jgi:NADPH-dependent 2,4-dienoyl-CoA reductase/sulfur reductase-like enzyme
LFYSNPEQLEKMGATIKMNHKVVSIDTKNKTLLVNNNNEGASIVEFTDKYDKLIFAGGT